MDTNSGDFLAFELVIGIATVVLAPLVGRLIDMLFQQVRQWRASHNASAVYDNIAQLLAGTRTSQTVPKKLLRKVEVAWFKADNLLDHDSVMDADLKKRGRHLLTEARRCIDEGDQEGDLEMIKRAQELIEHENNLIIDARGRPNTGFGVGLAIAVIALLVTVAWLTASFPVILQWKLLDLVPLTVLFFSGVGGLARALFRFCFTPGKGFPNPIRTFVAIPVFGMITGMALYLAVTAGLIVFGNTSEVTNVPLFSIVAFWGGFFSDETIGQIHRMTDKAKTSPEKPPESPGESDEKMGGDKTNNEPEA